ncbi:MAG: FkbM family methyltransferase [Rhodospirillaceae bacterium]|nr:FkbM family methyltransferase [Rhodospirillaceae bacterium]
MQINRYSYPIALAMRQFGTRVRVRGWERLLRFLFHPDLQSDFHFEIPFHGFRYPARADSIIDWNALFYGAYEAFELRVLAALADTIDDAVFVDVGANVGHHALYMAAHAAGVHVLEPNPALWARIEEKVGINGLDNMFIHKLGLGAENSLLPLYLGPESGEASLLMGASRTTAESNVEVSIVRGDDFFREQSIGSVDIIKLDIEGAEADALVGMGDSLADWRPYIMLEISELGKCQFGAYASFMDMFPENYEVFLCRREPGLTVRLVTEPADAATYSDYTGNAFCVPIEKRRQFIAAANLSMPVKLKG